MTTTARSAVEAILDRAVRLLADRVDGLKAEVVRLKGSTVLPPGPSDLPHDGRVRSTAPGAGPLSSLDALPSPPECGDDGDDGDAAVPPMRPGMEEEEYR